jgi:hypothetical protein
LTGLYFLVVGLVIGSIIIATRYSHAASDNILLEKVGQWVTIAGNLEPVLYIMNFLSELSLLKKKRQIALHRNLLKTLSDGD